MSPFAKILGLVWVAVLFAVVLLALAGGAMLVVFLIAAGVCLGIVFVLWQALRQRFGSPQSTYSAHRQSSPRRPFSVRRRRPDVSDADYRELP